MAKNKIGRQTPTQSYILPYKKSLGEEAANLYAQSGRTAQKWQVLLLRDIMAVGKNGLWTHAKFGYSIPRRNGKNEVIVMRELWGLEHGERICHTAHRTTTSHAAWERLCRVLDESGYEELGRKTKDEQPREKSYRTSKKYGLETVEFPEGGSICFRTRTESGGLGEGYDLLIIDEAQEYTQAQESTLVYTVSDSPNPQTLLCGTPNTMVSAGTVFTDMRDAVLSGNGFESGWAEWGVTQEPNDIHDKSLWYESNPSLGTILTERKIESEIRSDKLDFMIQRLGYWFRYSLKSAISREEWESMRVQEIPEFSGKISVGVKFGKVLNQVALSVAVRTWDDRIFVETIDCRPIRDGNTWMLHFLQKTAVESVVIDGACGQQELADQMRQMGLLHPVLPKVADVINAASVFEQMLADKRLCHAGQPSLTASVSNCDRRPIGSAGGFGYKSIKNEIDVSLLESVVLASWACSRSKTRKKQEARY